MVGVIGENVASLSKSMNSSNLDKPEFLNQKPLLSRTTTDVDTNPVLSDIQVPKNIDVTVIGDNMNSTIEKIPEVEIRSGTTLSSTDALNGTNSLLKLSEASLDLDAENTNIPASKSIKFQRGLETVERSRIFNLSLSSATKSKRSSIYESRSTVTVIPIRTPSSTNKSYQQELDDTASLKSMSSSLTASYSRSFLFGFYNHKRNGDKRNKSVISREYWMKDESVKECFQCASTFNTFRRKHHCRICGQIFCSNCTFFISGEKFGYTGKMRICNSCHEHTDNYQDSSDESSFDETSFYDQTSSKIKNYEHSLHSNLILNELESSNKSNNHDESKIFLSNRIPLPRMAIPATRQGESLEITIPANISIANGYPISSTTITSNHNKLRSRRNTKDRQNIHDINLMLPITPDYTLGKQACNTADMFNCSTKSLQTRNFCQSFTSYISGNNNGNIPLNYQPSSSNVVANLANNNFKFEFNYCPNNLQNYMNKDQSVHRNISSHSLYSPNNQGNAQHENNSEDEGSMSLYSALNDSYKLEQNPIRSVRNSTKSFQRAQASLERMRSRRKSKSKLNTNTNLGAKQFSFLNYNAPNSISVISNDNDFNNLEEFPSLVNFSFKGEILSSKDLKRVISTNSAFKLMSQNTRKELTEVAELHMNALLKQVLMDQGLVTINEWINIFEPLLSRIQEIDLDAKKSDDLDFKQHYIKIKRIPGGYIEDTELIKGIVFSKSLPLKKMPRMLKNPRILLVMFPLDYQKHESQFLSLESVMAQEKEYLKKLVLRLTSWNPDIIFVGANVSGYALNLLNDAGIVVQYNMKPQVIERISKITESDIAISVDKLAKNVKLGTCKKFEVKTFIYKNISKTYTFLSGCKLSLGATIVLRGEDNSTLRKIKDVAEFMVYTIFSLKLESAFYNDNCLQISPSSYEKHYQEKKNIHVTGYFSEFIEKFNRRLLSVSPMIDFPIPFLLSRGRELELKLENKKVENDSNDFIKELSNIENLDLKSILTPKDLGDLKNFISDKEVEELELKFKRRKHQWEVCYSLSQNLLGTGSHQSISVLYSVISTNTATPCIGPQLVTIDYFWQNDISIGQFIENVATTAYRSCGQGCGGLMLNHYRSYVHGSGKVDVLVEKLQNKLPLFKNTIFMWSHCKKCETSTPSLQMNKTTWNYSLGKYLELIFWSSHDGVMGMGNCSDNFSKDHIKYFGFNDLLIRMEYSDIDIHELITPSPNITWKPHINIKLKVELYCQIQEKINIFYGSVINRLDKVKLDSIPEDRMISGQNTIAELKLKVETEKIHLFECAEKIYRNTPGDQHLHLNSVIRALHDNAAGWDTYFAEFEKKFLPTEKDIARITAVQLKKLFMDTNRIQEKSLDEIEKNIDELKSVNESSPVFRGASPGPKPSITSIQNHKTDSSMLEIQESNSEQQILPTNVTLPTLKQNIRSGYNFTSSMPNLSPSAHKVSSMRFQYDNKVSSRSDTKDSTNNSTPNTGAELIGNTGCLSMATSGNTFVQNRDFNLETKVGQLANFFDKIHFDALSKEFELQREMERLQLNKNKYKAMRVKSSKPIVEVYKDVKYAVDEPMNVMSKGAKVILNSNIESVTSSTETPDLRKGLETELENSIYQWSERILHSSVHDEHTNHFDKSSNTNKNSSNDLFPPISTATKNNKDNIEPVPPSEKSSLMKTLTNFWADRSATSWKPLEYPTTSSEHIFMDNDIIIREDEPSSLIAFCLGCPDYTQKMVHMKNSKVSSTSNLEHSGIIGVSDAKLMVPNSNTYSLDDTNQVGNNIIDDGISNSSKEEPLDFEKIITKKTGMHLRYQFQDGNSIMSCKIFFYEQFEALRRTCGCGDDNFVQSLSRCIKWDSTGGKSGSAFLKTLDDRFVIKELSYTELDAFVKFAPSYFEYMGQALFHDLPTALAKILGFYQIQIKNSATGKSFKMDVIIMENLFYEKKTSRIFDLKGSMRNRHVQQTGKENEVLLDENMVEYIYESPIFVREYDKKLLRASLWNDTLFLAKMNVMDYSLVIGVDNKNHCLTVGIIDCIRTFTWDKKLESWVKEKGLVGGRTKEPTVVTPKQYKNRFREAMEHYILMVPDPWYQDSLKYNTV